MELFLESVGLRLPLKGDVKPDVGRLSPLKLNELPRNDVAVDASEIRSPLEEVRIKI